MKELKLSDFNSKNIHELKFSRKNYFSQPENVVFEHPA